MHKARMLGVVAIGIGASAVGALPAFAAHTHSGMTGGATFTATSPDGSTGNMVASGNIDPSLNAVTVSGTVNYSATTTGSCYSKKLGQVSGGTKAGSVAFSGTVGGPVGASGWYSWSGTVVLSANGCPKGTKPMAGATTVITPTGGSATAYDTLLNPVASTTW